LYSLAIHKEATIRDLVVIVGDRNIWNFEWRQSLFQWEEVNVIQLVESLEGVRLNNVEDGWRWCSDPEGGFSVKSAFDSISKEIVVVPLLPSFEAKILNDIWASPTPSKVIAFSWQLLHDRVPTKVNLRLRGVLPHTSGDNCVWCCASRESATHLFLHCKMAIEVWYGIFKWLGVFVVVPLTSFIFSVA
jgi:hypothetical protein